MAGPREQVAWGCILALVLVLAGRAEGVNVVPARCSVKISQNDEIFVVLVSQTPDNPTWGDLVTLTVYGDTPAEALDGVLSVEATAESDPDMPFTFPVVREQKDLCSMSQGGKGCSVETGQVILEYQMALPSISSFSKNALGPWAPVTFNVKVMGKKDDGTVMGCIKFPMVVNPTHGAIPTPELAPSS